jgi:tetratricopeptide (TPR) repeat protein
MNSRLVSWGRGLFLAGIVLALVLVIPTAWFPFQLTKLVALAVCSLGAVVLFSLAGGFKELLSSRGFKAALLVALLPLVYLVSARFALDPSVAYSGYGLEVDTVVFVLFAFLMFVLSFAFFRTLRTVRLLLTTLSIALIVAVLFQLISIAFGTNVIPFQTFADRSVNLIGKWNDLGILASLLALFLLVRVELMVSSVPVRAVVAAGGALLVVLLGTINFPLAWALLLVGAIAVGLVRFINERAGEVAGGGMLKRVPWFSTITVALSIVFLIYGSAFNSGITSVFPVSSLEVRPSYQSTLDVWNASRGSAGRLLVGNGPNSFGESWLMHKPSDVNQTLFWNVDFNTGFSTLLTALSTVGFLGLIAWLIPLLLVVAAGVRAVRLSILRREDRGVALALLVSSVLLYGALAFYVPSQNIVLLSFVLAGATFGFLWRQGQSTRPEHEPADGPQGRLNSAMAVGAALALIVLMAFVGWVSARRFASELFVNRGVVALQAGNADQALQSASVASRIETTGDVLRLVVQAGAFKLSQIVGDKTLSQEQARANFQATLQQTIAAGQQAQQLNPHDYRLAFALAGVYEYLAGLGVQGAYESSAASYKQAGALNPQNPSIPFGLARLEAARGNAQGTEVNITEALKLKPNYTDAILFVVQLAVAQNNIPLAIQAATAAAQTAPGVAPIWFELGLLYYAAGNAPNAAVALNQAVTLVPSYANAKYFLGLTYAALGRNDDAIKQFEDLAKTNPDNSTVSGILSNLRAGQPPFGTSTSATRPASQVKPPAPVQE